MSPKDPSHLRSLPEALPNASFRRLRRKPCRTAFRRVPPVPEASPKPFLRKPLSTCLRNRPFGLSFGTCHVSRRLSPKLPRKPFEAAPRYLSVLSSEHATCFRVPSENPFSGSPPSHHVSLVSPRENPEYLPEAPNALRTRVPSEFPRMPPVAPRVPSEPEPQTSRTPPGSPRITPEDPPGHSASAPRVDHPGSEFFCLL